MNLKNFDTQLTKLKKSIENDINESMKNKTLFEKRIEFGLGDLSNFSEDIIADCSGKGIYFFEIKLDKPEIETIIEKYNKEIVSKNSPTLVKKRIVNAIIDENQFLPFYIGKRENIYARFLQHLELDSTKPTSALKLKARNTFDKDIFRFSYIKVETKHYDIVAPIIESYLRDKLNPIIGKH